MLVGFSQGGMDAQNIGAALASSGYNVKDVITLASPVIRPPAINYTTLHLSPQGDLVGGILAGPSVLGVPYAVLGVSFAQSYKALAVAAGDEYEPWIGPQGIQHGGFSVYFDLAEMFDSSATTSPVYDKVKQDIVTFSGWTLNGGWTRIDDGTPGGILVPSF